MKICILLVGVALLSCANDQQNNQPKYDANQPIFKRYSAFKSDLLYGYQIDLRGDGYSKAFADAETWCAQHSMVADIRVHPVCTEYAYANDTVIRHCNVSFKCQ